MRSFSRFPRPRTPLRSVLAGLAAALLAACSTVKTPPPGAYRAQNAEPLPREITFWRPWLLYSAASPYRSLHVEVDAVEGAEPPREWLDALKRFLETQCRKPGGVRVALDDVIPRRQAAGVAPSLLALRHIDGPPPGAAFLYVLYWNSALTPGLEAANPHAVVFPYPCAVFIDRNYNEAGFGDRLGDLILVHEAGHLVGAARDPRHGDGAHCGDPDCLMGPAFFYDPSGRIGPRRTRQTSFCPDCLADMARWRRTPAPKNLSFDGPLLVRRERGYSVLSMPNAVHLHAGDHAAAPRDELLAALRACANNANATRVQEGFLLSVTAEGEAREVLAGIEAAKRDPAGPVREAAALLERRIRPRL